MFSRYSFFYVFLLYSVYDFIIKKVLRGDANTVRLLQ